MPKSLQIATISLFIILSLFSFAYSQQEEQLTITTYYPAPAGSYDTMRVNRMSVGSQYRSVDVTNGNLIVSNRVGINTDIGGFTPTIRLAIGDTDTGLDSSGDGILTMYTNNVERIRITNDGKIGIGTQNPNAKLTVNGDINATGVLTADAFRTIPSSSPDQFEDFQWTDHRFSSERTCTEQERGQIKVMSDAHGGNYVRDRLCYCGYSKTRPDSPYVTLRWNCMYFCRCTQSGC